MKALTKYVFAGALLVAFGTANAATVSCPGSLGGDLNRQVVVSGALAGGECYYKEGNFQGDDVSDFLGNDYTMIAKNVAGTGFVGGATSGNWLLPSNFWLTYAEIFIGFHFGNANDRDPDSFLVELDPGTLSGTWALVPTNLANGLSNFYFFGRGTPSSSGGTSSGDVPSSSSGTDVPEPASSLVLLGLGLLGLGFMRRVKQSA